jgi:transmembrane sensor
MTTPDDRDPMTDLTAPQQLSRDFDPLQAEAYQWIARFMGGKMSATEVAELQAWYRRSAAHAKAYAQARQVWKALGPIAAASGSTAPDHSQEKASTFHQPIGRRLVLGGATAAAAAYLVAKPPLALWPSYAEWNADYRTGTGEQRQVKLANAVSLDLNTRTSIAIRSQTADAERVELISGEAAVSTESAKSLITVVAASGGIRATNAEFNLRCDDGRVTMSCLKGKVVMSRQGVDTPLGMLEQLTYDDNGIGAITKIDSEIVTAWRSGLLIFESTPLSEVIAEVNRYRLGRIILLNDELGRRRLTARLRTDETEAIISQIERIFGARVRTLPGGIVILT